MGLQRIFILACLFGLLSACSHQEHLTTCDIKPYDNSKLKSGTLVYNAPQAWTKVSPSSQMRIDEYIVDTNTNTRFAIYYFPNMINAVEENLARWKSQFKEDEHRKLIEKKQFNQAGLPFTIYHMTGTYLEKLEPMNPNSPIKEKPEHSTWGLVVETKEGTWFFKVVGPILVIKSNKDILDNLVSSCRLGGQNH